MKIYLTQHLNEKIGLHITVGGTKEDIGINIDMSKENNHLELIALFIMIIVGLCCSVCRIDLTYDKKRRTIVVPQHEIIIFIGPDNDLSANCGV